MSQHVAELNVVARELRTLMSRCESLLSKVELPRDMRGIKPSDVQQLEAVTVIAAKKFNVPVLSIYSRDRHEIVARVRQICMAIARREMAMTYEDIGKFFQRDHGTVMAGERAIVNMIDTSVKFAGDYQDVLDQVKTQLAS